MRLEGLAERARFAWQRRRYLRKAEAARIKAQPSRAREAVREAAAREPEA